MEQLLSYLAAGLANGALYSLVALGFVVVYKTSGVLQLAQGQLVTLGAYFAFLFAVQLKLNLWLAFPLAFVGMAVVALFIERFTFRPMLGQPIIAIVLMTLGLGFFLQGLMTMVWGLGGEKLPRFMPVGAVRIGVLAVSYEHVIAIVLGICFFVALSLFFNRTKTGLSMMATADDQQVAPSLGISTRRVISIGWIITALAATVAGILLASISPIEHSLVEMGLRSIAVVIIGGLESVPGVIVAGLLLGVLEALAVGYLDPLTGGGMREVGAYVILVIALAIKPHGFFGWKRIERV